MKTTILKKLIHKPNQTFNELWNKEGESNTFAYHLKQLEKEELIIHDKDTYSLSDKGRTYSNSADGETGKPEKLATPGVIIGCIQNGKILLFKRNKEPFFGFYGIQGGKIKLDQTGFECAQTEFFEETGLQCDVVLKGFYSFKTFHGDTVVYNNQMLVFLATNISGELTTRTREGENIWVKLEEIHNYNIMVNLPHTIEILQSPSFRYIEALRAKEADSYRMEILQDIQY